MQLDFGIQLNEIGTYKMSSSVNPAPGDKVQNVRFNSHLLVSSPIEHPNSAILDILNSDFGCNPNLFTGETGLEVDLIQESNGSLSINLGGHVIGYLPEVVVECAKMFNAQGASKMFLKYNLNAWSVVLP